MPSHNVPVVDDDNPCYCPGVSTDLYVESLRERLGNSRDEEITFAGLLYDLVNQEDVPGSARSVEKETVSAKRSSQDSQVPGSLCLATNSGFWPILNSDSVGPQTNTSFGLPKRRALPSSGLYERSRKRRRSSATMVDDNPWDLSCSLSPPRFTPDRDSVRSPMRCAKDSDGSSPHNHRENRMKTFEDQLYGPQIGSETPRSIQALATRLEAFLPGIRLMERILASEKPSHQAIVDVLSASGLLNARILEHLRRSKVELLDLTASALDEEGLNLTGRELLSVFAKPHGFSSLSEIDLSDIPLMDMDIVHIHHLPKLAVLSLENTGIGNEAIFHLVCMRRTLMSLRLSLNAQIDDDAVPAIIMLSKLRILSLVDTGVTIKGLRRLAEVVYQEDRLVDIELPYPCEDYINTMASKYMINPRPPFIVSPSLCSSLSVTALKRNLAEHAKFNPEIIAGGTRQEMAERLKQILEIRQLDLLVRSMVWGDDSDEEE